MITIMRRAATALAIAFSSAAVIGAASVKIAVKVDPRAAFKQSATYTWLESPEYITDVNPDLHRDERLEKAALDGPIRAAIDQAFSERGWRRVAADQSPDFQVVYYAFLSTSANASVLGSFYQYTTGWGQSVYTDHGRATTSFTIVEKGTLVVDVIDPGRKAAVWRGTATGTLERTRDQAKRIEVISDAIKKLFRKFPSR
jgi:hypothetical protein